MYKRLDRQSLGIFRFEFEDDCEDENKLFFFFLAYSQKNIHPGKLYCFVCLFVVVVVVFFLPEEFAWLF